MRIAYLTSADMLPGLPDVRGDAFELDQQLDALLPACAARGLALELRVWDDPALDAAAYDAVVVGTTWDYAARAAQFLDRMDQLGRVRPLLNPPPLLRWNADKRYLRALEQRGAPVVPTLWVDRVDAATLAQAHAALDSDELVAKPVVGAGAWRQARIRRGQPLPPPDQLPPGAAMVQPFLPAAASEGEYSLVFIGDALSHALVKRAAPGDYRVQSIYGGVEAAWRPDAAEVALARAVLAAARACCAENPLYARVDMMRSPGGDLRLMELELIEPFLYPLQGPELGERYAAALAARLSAAGA